ncbi:hypothetical protein GCM10025861_19460 [Methanobacterium petrolearium]|nr:hypothetical protein GCM10025861_19460 [Methanobacterium petrolearium]
MIFLRRNEENYFEVLDGQQRLKSIFKFLENEYPTSGEWTPEVGKKTLKNSKMFQEFMLSLLPLRLM